MPPKRGLQTANMQTGETEGGCDLTVASLEATLQKFFSEAEKQSKERFERLENQIGSLKVTLDAHTKDLENKKKTTASLQKQLSLVKDTTAEQENVIKMLQHKMERMEDNSRRNNLRIINLREGVEKGQALAYLMSNLPTWFPDLTDSTLEIMRAHRIGPPRSPADPPRTMIINFLRFADRDRIMNLARKSPVTVEGHTIRFAVDFCDSTARRRRACYPVLNRARTMGYRAFLIYPAVIKLSHGAVQHRFEDANEATKFLDTSDSPLDSSAKS